MLYKLERHKKRDNIIFITIILLTFSILSYALTINSNANNTNTNINQDNNDDDNTNLKSLSQTTQLPPVITESSTSQCHMIGILPDSICTPGSIDPKVTQGNIHQTICVSGYSKSVRPSSSITTKLKVQQISEYGFSDTKTTDYEEDHLISLELGGAPADPKNLWPEPGASPNPKDKIENKLHSLICNGTISLKDAQNKIALNWTTAISGN